MKGLPRWFFALFALLGVVALLQYIGRKDTQYLPSIESPAPSGTKVFAELLRGQGYQVSSYNGEYVRGHKTDLLVCFYPTERGIFDDGDSLSDPLMDYQGKVLTATYKAGQFEDSSDGANAMALLSSEGAAGPTVTFASATRFDQPNDETIWTGNGQAVSQLVDQELIVGDPLGATNQFIDRGDNAAFWVGMVKNLVPKGGTVLFWEGPMGAGNPPTFLEELSLPLARAWGQVLLIGLVIVLTLGVRFGQPVPVWNQQRGTRDLLVAFGDLLKQGKQIGLVQEIIHRNVLLRLRRKYGLGLSHGEADLLKVCTPEEAEAIRNLRFVTNTPAIAMPRILDALRVSADDRRR